MPGAALFTSEIRTLSADVMIIVMAAEKGLHAVMENLKHSAEAFVVKPVSPVSMVESKGGGNFFNCNG